MKKLIVLGILMTSFWTYAQDKPKIKGSRVVSEVSEYLQPYAALEIHDGLTVNLIHTDEPYYKLESDDNLLDVVQFEQTGNSLKIYTTHRVTRKKKLEIDLGYNTLQNITLIEAKLKGAADIESDTLQFTAYGSSKADIDLKGQQVTVALYENSGGRINVNAEEAKLTFRDRIDVNLGLRSEMTFLTMDESADAKINGDSEDVEVILSGASRVKGSDLRIGRIKITADRSADAHIYASKSMEIYANGSCKIYVYGNPDITLKEFNDKAQLLKK